MFPPKTTRNIFNDIVILYQINKLTKSVERDVSRDRKRDQCFCVHAAYPHYHPVLKRPNIIMYSSLISAAQYNESVCVCVCVSVCVSISTD